MSIFLGAAFLYGMMDASLPYFAHLGSDFWITFLSWGSIIAWIILLMRTGKGLLHWLGVAFIALGAMLDALPGWIWDGVKDACYRMPAAARARTAELPK